MRGQPRVKPFWSGLTAGVVLVVLMAAVVISGVPGGPTIPWPWGHNMSIKVELANADALAPHASVQVAGVKVGEVRSVKAHGDLAVATLDIDSKYGDIRGDAQILLRPHGLFGPKYIEITPGSGGAPLVHDGDTISVRNSVQPVDLDQVLQALQAPEAQNLRTAIVELGKSAAGRGDDVNHLLSAANTLSQNLQAPLQSLDSVAPNLSDFLVQNEAFNADFSKTPLDQLVANSNKTLKAFADNAAQLESLLTHADSTLTHLDSTLGGESPNIRQTIETLPSTTDKLTAFNKLLALFGANLTGKDTSISHDTDVTQGIIGAIENVRSAFASFDPCTPSPGSQNSKLPDNHCPSSGPFAGQQHYLRVQVFNFGNTGGLPSLTQIQQQLCGLPVFSLATPTKIPCPTQTGSYQSQPAPNLVAGEFSSFAALLVS